MGRSNDIVADIALVYRNTTVTWQDGTTTTVKCHPDDRYGAAEGVMYCMAKKILGDEWYKKVQDLVAPQAPAPKGIDWKAFYKGEYICVEKSGQAGLLRELERRGFTWLDGSAPTDIGLARNGCCYRLFNAGDKKSLVWSPTAPTAPGVMRWEDRRVFDWDGFYQRSFVVTTTCKKQTRVFLEMLYTKNCRHATMAKAVARDVHNAHGKHVEIQSWYTAGDTYTRSEGYYTASGTPAVAFKDVDDWGTLGNPVD